MWWLYKYLLEGIGIPVTTVETDIHAWNHVKIDGKWYGVDVTLMDHGDYVASYGEDLRYDMTNFLMPDKYLVGSNGKNRGASDKRFVPVFYDSIASYNKDFGGTLDTDGDLVRERVDSDGSVVIEGAINYLKYWNSKKDFVGKIDAHPTQFMEPDYRYNPWFTNNWQNY